MRKIAEKWAKGLTRCPKGGITEVQLGERAASTKCEGLKRKVRGESEREEIL